MSPFMIFAVVLTFAYIVYFAVTIMRDLYGKKDEGQKQAECIGTDKKTRKFGVMKSNETVWDRMRQRTL